MYVTQEPCGERIWIGRLRMLEGDGVYGLWSYRRVWLQVFFYVLINDKIIHKYQKITLTSFLEPAIISTTAD